MTQPIATQTTATVPWYRTITREQWRVLAAAKIGWMLDAMDFMLYAMALGQLRAYFEFDDATAGLLGTVTLVMSGVGGLIFGYVADRFGRTRALMGTIVIFSLASLGAATSQSVCSSCSGAPCSASAWAASGRRAPCSSARHGRPQHRNKAISIMQSGWAIGYILAALLAALILSQPSLGDEAWRWLFVVGVRRRCSRSGSAATCASRRRGPRAPRERDEAAESVQGHLRPRADRPHAAHHRARRRRAVRVLGTLLLAAAVPVAARSSRGRRHGRRRLAAVDHPDADRRVSRVSDVRLHRGPARPPAHVRPVHALRGRDRADLRPDGAQPDWCCCVLGPLLGYFGHGYFSMFGGFVAELFPTAVRATGQGTSYNVGRMAGAIAPFTIGAAATLPGVGIGLALGITSAFFLAAALLVFTLPDRSGQALE